MTRFLHHAHFSGARFFGRDEAYGVVMTLKKMVLGVSVCMAAILTFSMAAEAKRARCFTTDDGYFSCNYRALDSDGTFRISAPGYPAYVLEVDGPGFAYGYVNLGRRNVPLPGQFVRSRDDGACWNNPQTNTKLCAW
ncbi:hypothetical protein [Mesorhizobium metallidurans]|uniref:hypothetical protein n=1 Tax=Mesorhizobium metallidurans TaxID=489722 RepID=UPI00034D15FC|nr:hypothetical protein [Mesorhizobium metallidurans]